MDDIVEMILELLNSVVEEKGCLKWLAILTLLGICGFLIFKYVL